MSSLPRTISRICETRGSTLLIGPHPGLRLTAAYAVVHDNIAEEVLVEIPGVAGPVKFSATEKKGSAKEFRILPPGLLPPAGLEVTLTRDRRVSIYVTIENGSDGNHG
jgi:hypothetical protein